MSDRSGTNALGKVFLFVLLLVVFLAVAATFGWSDHQLKSAQADLQRVTAERLRAELEAEEPYMPEVKAVQSRQEIAQMESDGQTRALMDDLARQTMIDAQAQQRAKAEADLAFRTGIHQALLRLVYVAGVAVILIVGAPAAYVLFSNVRERTEAAAQQRAAHRSVAAAPRPYPASRPLTQPLRPQPVTGQPPTGRLPGVPTGQPKREPMPAVGVQTAYYPAPAVRSIPIVYRPEIIPGGNGHSNGHSNGVYPSTNGATPNGRGR